MAGAAVTPRRRNRASHPNRLLLCFVASLAIAILLSQMLVANDAKEKPSPAKRFRELRKLYHENASKAVKGFREFLKEYPDGDLTDDARYWLAMSLQRVRAKPDEIIQTYETLITKHPKSDWADDALFAVAEIRARTVRKKEDYPKAVEAYEKFIKTWPKSERLGEAKLKIGELYRRMGKREKAIAYYRRVLDEHPKSPFTTRARMQMARTCYRLGKIDEAMKQYLTLLKSPLPDRERINARLGVVDCHLRRKDGLDKAIAECRGIREEANRKKALEDYADYATREKLAGYYMRKRRHDEAEREYQAYIDRYKTSVGVWQARLNIGIIRVEAKKYSEARKMFTEINRKFCDRKKNPPWYLTRSMFYEALAFEMEKDLDQARRLYKKLIEQFPKSSDARQARKHLDNLEKAKPKKP